MNLRWWEYVLLALLAVAMFFAALGPAFWFWFFNER